MIAVIILVLLIASAVCFLAAAANAPTRINMTAAGLLLWVVTVIIKAAQALH